MDQNWGVELENQRISIFDEVGELGKGEEGEEREPRY